MAAARPESRFARGSPLICAGTSLAAARSLGARRSMHRGSPRRLRLPPPSPRADRPLPARRLALADVSSALRREWQSPAIRRDRIRRIPSLRPPRIWLPAHCLLRMRLRAPRRVLVQAPWILPVLPRSADGRHGRPPRRARPARGAYSTMGLLAAVAPARFTWPGVARGCRRTGWVDVGRPARANQHGAAGRRGSMALGALGHL